MLRLDPLVAVVLGGDLLFLPSPGSTPAALRCLSMLVNMFRRPDALAYSLRRVSGYSEACFSYESLGACPSTCSATYCAHPDTIRCS